MYRLKNESLVELINCLSKGEKRYFSLSVQTNEASKYSLFYKLFKHIEKEQELNEVKALKKIKGLKANQISNLKKQIYLKLLESLRGYHSANSIELQLRSQIDTGKLLYNKGLYNQSLVILNRAKNISIKNNLYSISLEIVEFEKYIESQHITNADEYRAEALIREFSEIQKIVNRINIQLDLSLSLYDLYLKQGFAKNESKFQLIEDFFAKKSPLKLDNVSMSFFEKLYLIQSYVWYNYMLQNFKNYYRYSKKWIELFEDNPHMIELRPTLFLKGLHNYLMSLYYIKNYKSYKKVLVELKNIENEYPIRMDINLANLKALYWYLHKIDLYFMDGDFKNGMEFVRSLEPVLVENPHNWDVYRIMNFHYKIASMYFGNDNYEETIQHLNIILDHKKFPIHSAIYSYSLILLAMAHFDLGNIIHIDYLLKSIFRHLKLKENLQEVELAIIKFIRKLPSLTQDNYLDSFKVFKTKLEDLQQNKFEKRAFLFLDIISWLEAKIDKKPIAEIIKNKRYHHD